MHAIMTTGGVLVALLGSGFLPVSTESPATAHLSATAPAGATMLWIDADGALDPAATTISLKLGAASDWTPLPVAATAFGLGATSGVAGGPVAVRFSSPVMAEGAISLTFADAAGTILQQSRTSAWVPEGGGPDATTPTQVPMTPVDVAASGKQQNLPRTGADDPAFWLFGASAFILTGGLVALAAKRRKATPKQQSAGGNK